MRIEDRLAERREFLKSVLRSLGYVIVQEHLVPPDILKRSLAYGAPLRLAVKRAGVFCLFVAMPPGVSDEAPKGYITAFSGSNEIEEAAVAEVSTEFARLDERFGWCDTHGYFEDG